MTFSEVIVESLFSETKAGNEGQASYEAQFIFSRLLEGGMDFKKMQKAYVSTPKIATPRELRYLADFLVAQGPYDIEVVYTSEYGRGHFWTEVSDGDYFDYYPEELFQSGGYNEHLLEQQSKDLDERVNQFVRDIGYEVYAYLRNELEFRLSNEHVDEMIVANGYMFDEYGDIDEGGIEFGELDDRAKNGARSWYRDAVIDSTEVEHEAQTIKGYLEAVGWEGVEIDYRVSGSQGDGASFKGSIDALSALRNEAEMENNSMEELVRYASELKKIK